MKTYMKDYLCKYKGEFYGKPSDHYQDPITGAHFKYKDVFHRLQLIQEENMISLHYATTESPSELIRTEESNYMNGSNDCDMFKFLFKSQDASNDCKQIKKKQLISLKKGKL